MPRKRARTRKKTRLFYFTQRNTGVAATSAKNARAKKKRGGNKIVAIRTPKKGEMSKGWSRVRRDGKSPAKSKYGKGRGQGPPRRRRR